MITETRCFKATELRVGTTADGKPSTIEGYAAVFNSLSEPLGAGKQQFREKIRPGAFARAIAAGADVRGLFNHDANHILGRTKSGTLDLREDDKGLRFSVKLNPDDAQAMSTAAKIQRGDVDGCSFAFRANKDAWAVEDGQTVRELIDCDLFDVGPVVYPAYEATSVDVRSANRAIAKLPAEARATIEIEDDSLVYCCRYAIDYFRYAFDACQNVMDVAGRVVGDLNDRDVEAIDDCLSTIGDLIAKARRAKAVLQAMGAEDEDAEDPATAAAEGDTDEEEAASETRQPPEPTEQQRQAKPDFSALRRRLQLAEA